MSTLAHDHAAGLGDHHAHDDHAHHPSGITRWLTTTNHKDIGTMYLWFSFTMFLVGGTMAMVIRAELFQPGLQIVEPGVLQLDDDAARAHHGVRRDHARRGRVRELADPADDRRARHGVRADEQLELLAAAAGGAPARDLAVRSRRRGGGRLDALSAAHRAGGDGHGPHDLRRPHPGRVVDHGLDQHHHDDPEPARARHDADADAALLLDVAHHRLPADRGDARAGRRRDDAAHRPPLRHDVLQRGRRRRSGAVPARVLVLRAPRGLHHHPARVRDHLADHPRLFAEAALRLRVDGLRDGRHRDPVVHRLGAPHVHHRDADRRDSCSSCTRRC